MNPVNGVNPKWVSAIFNIQAKKKKNTLLKCVKETCTVKKLNGLQILMIELIGLSFYA